MIKIKFGWSGAVVRTNAALRDLALFCSAPMDYNGPEFLEKERL
jgi:hypothetical protein